jgi:hypothetical protein
MYGVTNREILRFLRLCWWSFSECFTLKIEALRYSETSVTVYRSTASQNIPVFSNISCCDLRFRHYETDVIAVLGLTLRNIEGLKRRFGVSFQFSPQASKNQEWLLFLSSLRMRSTRYPETSRSLLQYYAAPQPKTAITTNLVIKIIVK